ncbi:MAG: hypothetical protein HN683_04680 [Gammaproteobacteria bacterium]|nr:hypothetical protein [Gammaproteobacteria bacterium]
MAQIIDPDGLSQGAITTPGDFVITLVSTITGTMTGSASLPAVTAGDYIELRDATTVSNNGLYLVTGSPTTSSISVTKQALTGTPPDIITDSSSATARIFGTNANEKNIHFDTTNRIFSLINGFGSVTQLTNDGVLGQALYSFMKEEWKNDADLIKFPFPMTAITPEQFEFNEWRPIDEAESTLATSSASDTRALIRTAGWDEVDVNGFLINQRFGWVTLGNIDASDFTYGFWDSALVDADIVDATFDGPANEAVASVIGIDLSGAGTIAFATSTTVTSTTGDWVADGVKVGDSITFQNAEDGANDVTEVVTAVATLTLTFGAASFTTNADDTAVLIAIDHRTQVFTPRIRVFGKTYDQSTTTAIGVSAITNQVYRFPLSEAADPVITDLAVSEANADGGIAPYNDMSIAYTNVAETRDGFVLGDTKAFGVIIDGDVSVTQVDGGGAASAEQIYAFVAARLLNSTDINDGALSFGADVIGRLAEPLLVLASTGNTMTTSELTVNPVGSGGTGVTVDSFSGADKNRVAFVDNSSVTQTFPLTVTVTLNFNSNLTGDAGAVFTMFFTNDDTGDNSGRDYGTIDAIIVDDDTTTDISGAIPGATQNYNFAYDENLQRGTGSDSTDAPVTIVAIGLSLAQYVIATGTITNTGLTASLVAALERNFSNP